MRAASRHSTFSTPMGTFWRSWPFRPTRLRITSLRASSGPGVEFLEYLAPRTGRGAPRDTAADDLWYWQINFQTAAPEATGQQLRAARVEFLSPGVTATPDGALGFHAGLIVRDPDGHASLIGR